MTATTFLPDDGERAPEVLEVNVSESVGTDDMIGNPPDKTPALMRYVKFSGKLARQVLEDDIPRLLDEAVVMGELCRTPTGAYSGANAVSHNQIDDKDPLRFFVSSSGEIIVNPKIVGHTKVPVDSIEACTSFPERPPKTVQRYHKVTAQFQLITTDKKLSEMQEEGFSGAEAKVFQHECEHLNGHHIYEAGHDPEWSVGEALLTAKPDEAQSEHEG